MIDIILRKYFKDLMKDSYFPKDRRMKVIEDVGIEGLSSENIRFVINELVRRYAGTYLEVGSYKGCSLISAALYNEKSKCIGIDNFSEFADPATYPYKIIMDNAAKVRCDNIKMFVGDYHDVIPQLDDFFGGLKIDVYMYDGKHDYDSQLEGLNIIEPYLNYKSIILVDDSAWPEPHRANMDWLENNMDFDTILLSTYSPDEWEDGDENFKQSVVNNKKWWNGLRIFWRGIDEYETNNWF
jgi:hypothetical protein